MQQTLQPNSLLQGGKYHIIESLGQGGFGITYLGEQTSLSRKVAIKEFFMKDLCNRDDATSHVSVGSEGSREMVNRFREKFVKEAKSIARLVHPNIVRVIDIFEENGTAYYVMEYCEGGSLSAKLRQQYPDGMPSELALKYIHQIASALDYIHQLKINHLDVKPANVMLNERGDAVLIDFGLAKQYDAQTGQQTSSTPVGISEGYAPMEQYKKGGVAQFSPTTDIYSLGATLYKLVTGQTPPNANDILNDGLPELPVSIPTSIAEAIRQSMQPRKIDRPQSVAAWLNLLDAEPVVVVKEEEETTRFNDFQKEKDEREARAKAEKERKAREEAEQKTQAEAARKTEAARKIREEAERKKKEASSASQSSEPASKKPWLWGIAAVVALALVWLVWPKSQTEVPPVVETELVVNTADSIKDPTEQLAVDTKVETTKPEKKEEIKQEEPVKTVEPKKEEPKKEEPKKEKPVRAINANGHDYVDLGLKDSNGRPIYWATCNVGASKPEDYGLYFMWGETKGYTRNTKDGHEFDWANYKWCNGTKNTMTKYCTDSEYGTVDNKKTLSLSDDAAHVNWGGDWRMPTKAEQDQLRIECKWTWDKSRKGYTVKGPNGNSIFLPAAGCRTGASLNNAGSYGIYWSSSLSTSYSDYAFYLYFNSGYVGWINRSRYYGRSVRAVCMSSE